MTVLTVVDNLHFAFVCVCACMHECGCVSVCVSVRACVSVCA